jgi:hypothetical protein
VVKGLSIFMPCEFSVATTIRLPLKIS